MCLSIRDLEEVRLEQGIHLGFEYEIVKHDLGHRCGYIRVLPNHPWFGKRFDELEGVSVHGGLTFAEHGTACPTHGEEAEWWVGFDCSHSGDNKDLDLMSEPLREWYKERPFFINNYGTVKSTEYVRKECFKLARQAKKILTKAKV